MILPASEAYVEPIGWNSEAQKGFYYSGAAEVFAIAGRGFGKTHVEGEVTRDMFYIDSSQTLLLAPTGDLLRNSTLQGILYECWLKHYNLVEDEHYVYGKKPPKHWGVRPYSPANNHGVITTCYGAYIICDQMENYNKHRGPQYDRIIVDEFQNVTPDVRNVLLGGLRGQLFKRIGLPPQIFYAMTPPKKMSTAIFIKELINDLTGVKLPNGRLAAEFFYGKTMDNVDNLPDGFVDMLLAGMDETTARREVYGEVILDNASSYLYEYDERIHVATKKEECAYDPRLPLYFFMDFNIDIMATSVWQLGQGWAKCIDEFKPYRNCDIDSRSRDIQKRYGDKIRGAIFTGDPSGKARTGLGAGLQYYVKLKNNLGLRDTQIQKKMSQPDGRDARQDMNSILSRMDILIAPHCENTRQDFLMCQADVNGFLDKSDSRRTHYLDAAKYGWHMHLKPQLSNVKNLRGLPRKNAA